jgi:hypothetical protein
MSARNDPGFTEEQNRDMEQARGNQPDPDWGGKISGPLKKEDLAYQMCHPRMCWRLFTKANYENLLKLMTFSTKNGKMFPNEEGIHECGGPDKALAASQQIIKNYGRTLQIQKLLFDPANGHVDPLMICREYLELHEATRVALRNYQRETKGDFHQKDGMELATERFNNQGNQQLDGYRHARSSASEASKPNNKWAPKLKRTKLAHTRVPQKLHEFTYKWM